MAVFDRPDVARVYREVRGVSDEFSRTWGSAFRAALPAARPHRSLDLGCGTGRFTALLAEVFGGFVLGLDASLAMLDARHASGGAAVAFGAADATTLPIRSDTMDLVLLSMVYHLLRSPAATAAELHRVLGKGGVVLVRTPTREILDRIGFLPCFLDWRIDVDLWSLETGIERCEGCHRLLWGTCFTGMQHLDDGQRWKLWQDLDDLGEGIIGHQEPTTGRVSELMP